MRCKRLDTYRKGDIVQFDPEFTKGRGFEQRMPAGIDFIVMDTERVPIRAYRDVGHTQWVIVDYIDRPEVEDKDNVYPKHMSAAFLLPIRNQDGA